MITVREATSADVPAITEIFQACYGADYSDSRYYGPNALAKLVSSDDTSCWSPRTQPRIAEVAEEIPLFGGLNPEQIKRLAGVCTVSTFEPGAILFREGGVSDRMYVLLEGKVEIAIEGAGRPLGVVTSGECLGEVSLLTASPHSATATAGTAVETAVLDRGDLAELVRLRPDIGMRIYKNLAIGLGKKLKRSGSSVTR